MPRLFRRTKDPAVEVCDGCGSVCTVMCGRNAAIADVRDRATVAYGWRLA